MKETNSKSHVTMRLMKLLHFAVSIGLFIAAWSIFLTHFEIIIAFRYKCFVVLAYAALEFYFNYVYNSYMVEFSNVNDIAYSLSLSTFISTIAVYLITIIAWNKFYAPWIFLIFVAVGIVWNVIWAKISADLYSKVRKPSKTAIIYRNETDLKRIREVYKYGNKYDISVIIEDPEDAGSVISRISDCEAVFVTGVNASLRNGIAEYCMENDIQGFFLPHFGDIIMNGSRHVQAFRVPIMRIKSTNNEPGYEIIKRTADFLISLIAVIILSPIMLVCAVCIKLEDGGPVLYRQIRLTRDGKQFKIIKFRSMRTDAESDGVARLSTGESDTRITKTGRVLRKCRLDEIPQLFNILSGDMAIVGPRPERPELAEEYCKIMPSFRLRLKVKAGLTGYAQVYGKYNTDPYDKLEMDLMYINQRGILSDLKLMFATVRILFLKESTEGIPEGQTSALDEADKKNTGSEEY